MQNVNLLDRRLIPAEPLVRSATALAAFGVVLLGVLAHAGVERWISRSTLHAAQAPVAEPAAAAPAEVPASTAALRARLAEREALLHALRRETQMPVAPEQTLRAVVAALPETMWLSEVELSGARDLRISGGTLDPQALTEFARRLAAASALRGLGLQTVRLEPQTVVATQPDAPTPAPTHSFVLASKASAAGAAP